MGVLFEWDDDGGRGIRAVDNIGDRTDDEDEDERISRSCEENGVVLQEREERDESNKDVEGEVSSGSEIIIKIKKFSL